MSSIYKRILAAALFLALTATIVPATVFAADGFAPGELNVILYEQYYTIDDEVYGNLADILPEIEIESYSDLYLSVLESSPIPRERWKPSLVVMVGTTFNIKLTEKTVEAVETAIAALKDNPYVKCAEPNGYAEPDYPFGPIDGGEDEPPTIADALVILRVSVHLVEASPEFAAICDIDGDGKVTVADALIVLRLAAGLA